MRAGGGVGRCGEGARRCCGSSSRSSRDSGVEGGQGLGARLGQWRELVAVVSFLCTHRLIREWGPQFHHVFTGFFVCISSITRQTHFLMWHCSRRGVGGRCCFEGIDVSAM